MQVNVILIVFLAFFSLNVLAEEPCGETDRSVLKIENIDMEHTGERLDESLDLKVNTYEPKPKFKNEQKLDLSIKNNKKPAEVKGNSIAEKDQRTKSNDFQKIKSPTGMNNSGSNIKLGIDIDLPNQ